MPLKKRVSMLSFWRQSLMVRLVFSFLLLSLTIVSLVGFIAYHQATEALKASFFERLEAVATYKEGELNRWVEDQMKNVAFIASLPDVRVPAEDLVTHGRVEKELWSPYKELISFFEKIRNERPDYLELFILTDQGGRIAVSTDAAREGDYRPKDLYFVQGRQGTTSQGVYASPMTLKPTLTIATPLMDSTGLHRIGVLAVHMDLSHMDRIVRDTAGLGQSGEAYLVDSLNDFVSAEQFGRRDFPQGIHTEGTDTALLGQNGSGIYENYAGVSVIGVYRWLEERKLALLVEMHEEEAFAPARQLAWKIVLVGFASAFVLTLGISALSRQIVRPIRHIASKALAVAKGDLNAVVTVSQDDEVGVLGRSFNEMVMELKVHRDHLEERVAERTEELESINTELEHQIAVRRKAEGEVRQLNEGLEQRVAHRTSELSIANHKLQNAKEAAEAASRAKGRFLANMSHELRTPLNIILGFSHLMNRDAQVTPDQRESLSTITRSGEHLLALINDILEISKVEAGRVRLKKAAFDLVRLLDDIERMMRRRAEEKGLVLRVEVEPDLPRCVESDETKLRQVLVNLLGNAIKFTQEGEVVLRVRSVSEGGTFKIHVEVEDTGIGFEPEASESIFDAFSQTDAGERAGEGTGLGLSISRQYVELMGGGISARKRRVKGSLFSFDFVAEPAEVFGGPSAFEGRTVFSLKPGDEKRVLIIENNAESRELLVRLLSATGFQVRAAEDGREGLAMFESWQPHLVWLDLKMPVMDGYETARRMRAMEGGAQTRIIALTASPFEAQKSRALDAGCDAFMGKPFKEDEIFGAMAEHLGVGYRYGDDGGTLSEEMPETLCKEKVISALPHDVLSELSEAASACDVKRVDEAIGRVRGVNEAIADGLKTLADGFRYDEILQLVQT